MNVFHTNIKHVGFRARLRLTNGVDTKLVIKRLG